MLTVIGLLKVGPSRDGGFHGERSFWREMGDVYLASWLTSVRQYVPEPKRILVMTDVPLRIADVHAVETVKLDVNVDAPGFWAKLEMFKHGDGTCLYLDLDNVINGPLDELCALIPDPLIMLDDRRVPGLPNGSAILFDAARCRGIWSDYCSDQRGAHEYFVACGEDYTRAYDQAFIADWLATKPTFFQDLLPDGYILNARSELPNAPDWRTARLIFGGGGEKEGKPHTSTHPGFSLR